MQKTNKLNENVMQHETKEDEKKKRKQNKTIKSTSLICVCDIFFLIDSNENVTRAHMFFGHILCVSVCVVRDPHIILSFYESVVACVAIFLCLNAI